MITYQKEQLSKSSISVTGDIAINGKIDFNAQIDNSEIIATFFRAIWNLNLMNEQEEVYAVFADNQNNIIAYKHLFKGGLSQVSFDLRVLFKHALMCNANAIFIAHNHPNGSLKPSKPDKALTFEVRVVAEKLGFRFLDHIILTSKSYFSFKDEGLLD